MTTARRDPNHAFNEAIKGRNIITPRRLRAFWTHDGQPAELCEGTDMSGTLVYAVSVVQAPGAIDGDRSRLFNESPSAIARYEVADRYAKQLERG